MDDLNIIKTRLENQPIAPIFNNSHEKDNIIAMKFMLVVDYYISYDTEIRLYERITNTKLMSQLLEFESYSTFSYYDYHLSKMQLDNLLFECTSCHLVGPVAYILTHMAINHNIHTAANLCVYCKCKDFKVHFSEDTMDECYLSYIVRNCIQRNENVCDIIRDFYEILKTISKMIGVYIKRNHLYEAKGRKIVKVIRNCGTTTQRSITIKFHNRGKIKNISKNVSTLNRLFELVIRKTGDFHRTPSQIAIKEDIIDISDEDDYTASQQSPHNSAAKASVSINILHF